MIPGLSLKEWVMQPRIFFNSSGGKKFSFKASYILTEDGDLKENKQT